MWRRIGTRVGQGIVIAAVLVGNLAIVLTSAGLLIVAISGTSGDGEGLRR